MRALLGQQLAKAVIGLAMCRALRQYRAVEGLGRQNIALAMPCDGLLQNGFMCG
jgi:hypothetical protein